MYSIGKSMSTSILQQDKNRNTGLLTVLMKQDYPRACYLVVVGRSGASSFISLTC